MSDQPQSLRVILGPVLAATACLSLAAPAFAQQAQSERPGETMGLRYLSWAGKPAQTQTPEGLRRPVSLTAPRATTTSTGRSSRYGSPAYTGPTPADVWTGGSTAMPAYGHRPSAPLQASPAPQPEPQAQQAPHQQHQTQTQTQAEFATAPDYTPARSVTGRPTRSNDPYANAPAQVRAAMQPSGAPVANATPYDPMAPRPDALIFRMGQDRQQAPAQAQPESEAPDRAAPKGMAQAAPARPGDAPREGARYYSLHRDAGHEPDPVVLPESVYIGGASMDLAEPPPAPVVQRTVNGRVQTIASNQDPSLP